MKLNAFRPYDPTPAAQHLEKEAQLKAGDTLKFRHSMMLSVQTGTIDDISEKAYHIKLVNPAKIDPEEGIIGRIEAGTKFYIERPYDSYMRYPWIKHKDATTEWRAAVAYIQMHGLERLKLQLALAEKIMKDAAAKLKGYDIDVCIDITTNSEGWIDYNLSTKDGRDLNVRINSDSVSATNDDFYNETEVPLANPKAFEVINKLIVNRVKEIVDLGTRDELD